jgi:hypothetical protein
MGRPFPGIISMRSLSMETQQDKTKGKSSEKCTQGGEKLSTLTPLSVDGFG